MAPDANLPAPLADPLRGLRTGLGWLNGVMAVYSGGIAVWMVTAGEFIAAAVIGGIGLLGFLWLYGVARLLPNRPTDILYLRSFRKDTDTADIRTALERAFGDGVRVSGIRDPRRRWPAVLRFMSYLVFAFKYAHPKYMNLEAGNEWKGRLWRSLGEARGVVIDVADLTAAVEAEVRLCLKSVGPRRILFVTRGTVAPDEWRRFLDLIGGVDRAADLHTAHWDDSEPPAAFEAEVRAFADGLPVSPAGFAADARELAEQLPDEQFRESNRILAVEIAIGLVLGTAVTIGVNLLREVGLWGPMAVAVLYFGWWVVLGRQYAEFRRHCGSARRLRLARLAVLPIRLGAIFGLIAVLVGLLLPDVGKVREAAARMKSSSNLKQIGLAMHSSHDNYQRLPAANAADPNRPWQPDPVSWRVHILPYIEQDHLHRQYRFDEPWDGPTNSDLASSRIRTYLCPSNQQEKEPAGHTFYRVFASPAGVQPSAAFLDRGPGLRLSDFTDGTSNTLLVVEAAEAVPWTKPEVLEFAPDRPLPKLGGHFRGGFNGVMADGSVRFFRSDRPDVWLRAFVTANGGEPTPID